MMNSPVLERKTWTLRFDMPLDVATWRDWASTEFHMQWQCEIPEFGIRENGYCKKAAKGRAHDALETYFKMLVPRLSGSEPPAKKGE